LYGLLSNSNEYFEFLIDTYLYYIDPVVLIFVNFIYSLEVTHDIFNYAYKILYYLSSLYIVNVLVVLLPVLLAVAFMTIIERKQLAAMQRRVGPNTVGFYGVLQPFADALKLVLKENVIPAQSNKLIFFLAPVSSLFFSLLG
jgi:NADH:ubiquinone oxidoreductase subunit H